MTTPPPNPARLPVYSAIDEPQLAFSADHAEERDPHPLRGVARYGPYSRDAFAAYTPTIRVATVGPAGGTGQVRQLLGSVRRAHPQQDRRDYVPAFPGIAEVFGADLLPAADAAHVTWPDTLDDLPGDTATDRVRRVQGNHYYQGGKSIPRPLLITRHAGAGPLEQAVTETLAMTKMDWNNDALYDPIPVTIAYAQRLARIIASDASLRGDAYPYRMFM